MSTVIEVTRPGPRAWWTLVRCEARMVARDTAGLIVPLALPLLILVMNAAASEDHDIGRGFTAFDAYVLPLVLVIVLASIGVINLPSFLAYYRRAGILRRLAVTPASPLLVLGAQLVVSVVQALLGLAIAIGVAIAAYDANAPARPFLVVAVLLLATLALYATGLVVASLAPTPNSAVAMGMVLFFAIGALGGMFGTVEALPDTLAEIGARLPFGAAVDALSAAWVGDGIPVASVVSLAVASVLGIAVAVRFFRWDR